MPQVIYLLEAADLAALQSGHTVPLPVGVTMLAAQTRRVASRNGSAAAAAASPRAITKQRGTCPYCQVENLLLYPHIRAMHPGKSVPWQGTGGMKCPQCGRLFPSGQSIRVHQQSHKKSAKKITTKSATKPKAAAKAAPKE